MDGRFECVIHHGGSFSQFHHAYYNGIETTWFVDPEYWSYFEVLGELKEMGYLVVESLWFYDPKDVNQLINFKTDVHSNRMKQIALMFGKVHLYVVHSLSQPLIEEYPTLEYFNLGPNEVGNKPRDEKVDLSSNGHEKVDNGPDIYNGLDSGHVDINGGGLESNGDTNTTGEKESGPNSILNADKEVVGERVETEKVIGERVGAERNIGERVEAGKVIGERLEDSDAEVQREDIALDVNFTDSEEEIGLEDNFGEVGNSENVHTEQVVGEGSGTKKKRKRGRPFKKQVEGGDNDVVIEDGNTIGIEDDASRPKEHGLGDIQDYNSDDLDSGCDSDSEDGEKGKKFPTFKLPEKMKDYKWEVGTYFLSKKDFQEAIRTYAVHSARNLKFKKNDAKRMRVVCKKECHWNLYCANIPGEETWQLRKVLDDHQCGVAYTVKLMNSKWLGGKLNRTVRENPSIQLNDIVDKAQYKWNLGVNKTKAYRARSHAIDLVDGSFRDQYVRVYDYAHELLRSNRGSTVKVKTQPFQGDEGDLEDTEMTLCPHFQRMYVCFKGCKESFTHCRPIIGLDGCFLKGYYGGQLLSTIGRDPNDQMLPIAFSVVEGETKETWAWFLELLTSDLRGTRLCKTFTFISDQQKGLLPAIEELLPGVDHRYCVGHLYNNFRKKFPGKKLKELMWRAAKATYHNAWEMEMNEIKGINEEAYNYLLLIPAKHWSKSKFTSGPRCDTLVNNMSEAFNSTIVTSRSKPLVTMFEEIRIYLMERWETNRRKVSRYNDDILPNIRKRLERESSFTNNWIVRRAGEHDFEVRHFSLTGDKFSVNLLKLIHNMIISFITGEC